jgi:hypothetical protein
LAEYVPDLIKNGIYLESITKNDKGLESHIFAAKVKIGGEEKVVGFIVREDANGKRYYVHDIINLETGTGRNTTGLVDKTTPWEPPEYPNSIRNIVKKHLGVKPLDENNYKWNPFREVYKEIQELYGRGEEATAAHRSENLRGGFIEGEKNIVKDSEDKLEEEKKRNGLLAYLKKRELYT